MNPALAIVIPAYKAKFLHKTLYSVANQTDKRFNLYIFNDASTDDIEAVINPFQDQLPHKYHLFNENLGSVSLTGQWKRCIENTSDEPWIWLLPDDDVIDSNCVDEFYKTIEQIGFDYNVLRFKTVHVNENDEIIRINNIPPIVESGFQFLIEKLNHRRNSTVAEYIFFRETYNQVNGFPDFPLGWASDEALWFSIAKKKGIYTCFNSTVYLRQSSLNISNDTTQYNYTKLRAIYLFFFWLQKNEYFINETKISDKNILFIKSTQFYIFDFIRNYDIHLTFKRIIELAHKNNVIWDDGLMKNIYRLIRVKFNSMSNKNRCLRN